MPRNLTLTVALPALLLTASLQSCTAMAATLETASRRVSYADLDLSRPKGAQTLYSRIHSAAREVCQPVIFTGRLGVPTENQVCIEQAIERAVADVNSPLLTSYFLSKSGRSYVLAQRS